MTTDHAAFPDPSVTVAPLLAVSDLSNSLHFWVDQIGGEATVQWGTYAVVQIGPGRLHLAVATLSQRGVHFLGPAAEPAWGGEVRAFALDPDGHLLEITSPT